MKNAVLLASIWVAIIIVAYAAVYWDRGIEQPLPISILEPSSVTYADPDGRFGLEIPESWSLEEMKEVVVLTDPSGGVEVTVSVVEEPIPETALLMALGIVGSDETGGLVEERPAAGASERAVRMAGPSSDGLASYGLAYLYEGTSVVLVVRGSADNIALRADDLALIEAGVTVPAPTGDEAAPLEEAEPAVAL